MVRQRRSQLKPGRVQSQGGGSHFEDWGLYCCLPPLRLLSSSSCSSSHQALSQVPPWGLSFLSPSPPPLLPTFLGHSWEPLGCCAEGGCLAGSLHRRPRHLPSCWEYGEGSWIATTVQSAPNRCLTPSERSSRTRGDTSTRTARMLGCLC